MEGVCVGPENGLQALDGLTTCWVCQIHHVLLTYNMKWCWQGTQVEAKAPTAEEFTTEVMAPLLQKVETELLHNPLYRDHFKRGGKVKYSFDNASIHTAALEKDEDGHSLLGELGFDEKLHRLPLPPYSGDMHRVIEHTHGTAVRLFRNWLNHHPGKLTIEEYKQQFEEIYSNCITKESVQKDVKTLPALYKWVADNAGNYPPAEMR